MDFNSLLRLHLQDGEDRSLMPAPDTNPPTEEGGSLLTFITVSVSQKSKI
jgi:hypothetical protein